MVIAALVAFAILLIAWLVAPAERDATVTVLEAPMQEAAPARAA